MYICIEAHISLKQSLFAGGLYITFYYFLLRYNCHTMLLSLRKTMC